MPSETMNTRFRFLLFLKAGVMVSVVGGPGMGSTPGFVALPCWTITERTMTVAVARRAQMKIAVSRRRDDCEDELLRLFSVSTPCMAASSSSACRSES